MANNSIKGFKVGNEVKKYDYNELDNLPENDPDDLAEEVNDLKSDINAVAKFIVSDENWTIGVGISNTGATITYTCYATSDFIEATRYYLYTGKRSTSATNNCFLYICEYTNTKKFIKRTTVASANVDPFVFEIDQECAYVRMYFGFSSSSMTSTALADAFEVFSFYNINEIAKELKATSTQVETYEKYIIGGKNITDDIVWNLGGAISAGGVIGTNSEFMYTDLIPVHDGLYQININGLDGGDYNIRVHAYNNDGDWVEQIVVVASKHHSSVEFSFKCKDYAYIRISMFYLFSVKYLLEPLLIDNSAQGGSSLGLHRVPKNNGVLNAIKRARQMTDIYWSPAGNLPRVFYRTGNTYLTSHSDLYRGTFDSGVQYKGLPYTLNHLVGQDASIDTFATAVVNQNSAEIVESVFVDNDKPSYYGTVCTGLTAYALDLPYIVSNYWPSVNGLSLVGQVNSLGFSSYELGDILQINGHCAIITDINDSLEQIEISEATRQGNINSDITNGSNGSLCRRIFLPFAEFKSWFDGFSVYRYAHISKVTYTPSKYSPMVDEENQLTYLDYPLLPYMGNKAMFSTYSSAPVVKLIISATGYTHVVVLKDGEPYNQNGTTDPYEINNATEIDITCQQAEGVYEACLIKKSGSTITASTVSCKWCCRPYFQPTVTIANGTATFSFTVKSNNFRPYFVSFGTDAPRYGNFIRLFNEDITANINGDGTTTYTFAVPYPSSNPTTGQLAYISEEFGMGQLTWNI